VPKNSCILTYENFLQIIGPFVNNPNNLDKKICKSVNPKENEAAFPQDENFKLFSFDLKKQTIWFTNISNAFEKRLTAESYQEIFNMIWLDHVYLLKDEDTTVYLPFKKILEKAHPLISLTGDISSILKIEGIAGIQQIILDYMLDAESIISACVKMGFFKPPKEIDCIKNQLIQEPNPEHLPPPSDKIP
jgi:hypothetical protein